MNILLMNLCASCVCLAPEEAGEGVGYPGTRAPDGCKLPGGC